LYYIIISIIVCDAVSCEAQGKDELGAGQKKSPTDIPVGQFLTLLAHLLGRVAS